MASRIGDPNTVRAFSDAAALSRSQVDGTLNRVSNSFSRTNSGLAVASGWLDKWIGS
jgi:hypothetical protein